MEREHSLSIIRGSCFQIRSKMVTALSGVKVESVESIKQVADAFDTVLTSPDEVTPDDQVRLVYHYIFISMKS